MADLLGTMNTALVGAYARSRQYEMPSVVAMSQAFDPVIDKARDTGEKALIARKAGVEALGDDFKGTKKERRQEIRTEGRKAIGEASDEDLSEEDKYYKTLNEQLQNKQPGVGELPDVTQFPQLQKNLPSLGRTSKIGFPHSPFKQLSTEQSEEVDYDTQLNELINRPGIDQLGINEFNAQKDTLSQAINIVAKNPAAKEQAIGLMNTFTGLNNEEKETKKLVVDAAKNISRGAKNSATQAFASYLNPANKKIMTLNPDTNKYQYATLGQGGVVTQDEVLKAVDQATRNDEAETLQLKYTNSIIKDARDATTNKPKDENYFNSLAKNVIEVNQNKMLSLIFDDIREGGNFADDLRENPEIVGLDKNVQESTYNAIINPDNPNFNRELTNSLLQQYFSLDLKKTHDSVRNQAGQAAKKRTAEEIINSINPNILKD